MTRGRFKRVGKSGRKLHGRRRLLVSGFDPANRRRLLTMLADRNLSDIPIVFVSDAMADRPLSDLLALDGQGDIDLPSQLDAAVIMAGITEKTLHKIMNGYRSLNLPPPLWAAVTPTSIQWSLRQLLAELNRERVEMANRR